MKYLAIAAVIAFSGLGLAYAGAQNYQHQQRTVQGTVPAPPPVRQPPPVRVNVGQIHHGNAYMPRGHNYEAPFTQKGNIVRVPVDFYNGMHGRRQHFGHGSYHHERYYRHNYRHSGVLPREQPIGGRGAVQHAPRPNPIKQKYLADCAANGAAVTQTAGGGMNCYRAPRVTTIID